MSGRMFSARYRDSVLFVSAPVLAAAPAVALVVLTIAQNVAAALAAAGLALIGATLAISAAKRARPALRLSDGGVEIDGLTVLAWSALAQVRVRPRDDDDAAPSGLELRFAQRAGWPADLRAVRPSPLWRPLEGGLFLRASLLEDAPDAIAEAFNYFLRRRAATE